MSDLSKPVISNGGCSSNESQQAQPAAQTSASSSNSGQAYDYLLKILLVGDSGVGKSCLLNRFAENTFSQAFITTIGVDFKVKTVELDGKKVKLQIWDTSGQERFRNITTAYLRGAHGIMVVYDVTNQNSFDHIQRWLRDIQERGSEHVKCMLVATKCDIVEERCVQYETAKEFADKHGLPFLETSPKDGTNVEEAFITITAELRKAGLGRQPELQVKQQQQHVAESAGGCCGGFRSHSASQTLVVDNNRSRAYDDEDRMFKILLIGDSGVGKSCLLLRFTLDCFSEAFITTIGVDFRCTMIKLDGKNVKLQIWDTAGQERFRTVVGSFYRGADGIMVAFDVTNQDSFSHVTTWLKDIDRFAPEGVMRMLVATKCDMHEQRSVDYATAKKFADEQGLRYIETSPKDGTNVKEAFIIHAADVKKSKR